MTARLAALLAALACAVPVAAHALDPSRAPSQYVHAAWSSESGLPQNTVYQMAETPDGLLWLATEEGLVAFDGARFEVHDKLRHPELETSAVRALSVAPDGALYAGTRVGQVCRFEHGHLTRCWGRAEGVDVGIFEAVLALDDGRVLAGGPEGLIAIAGDTARRVADVGVAALVRDERGALVATREGLARWDGARLSPLAGAPRGPVSALAREAGGTLWAAIDGVVHVEEDGALRPFFPEVLTEVRAVLRDRDGVVWIAARDGLHRVDEGAGSGVGCGG